MTHRLVLARHAKSSWDDTTLVDRDRPLAPRGVTALPSMREYLERAALSIDRVWTSPARRTLATLEGIRSSLPANARITVEDDLYGIDAFGLLARLWSVEPAVGGVLVVGHNPTMQMLASLLAGSGDPDAREQLDTKFPTGAIAALTFDEQWTALGPGSTHLDDLFMPRRPRP